MRGRFATRRDSAAVIAISLVHMATVNSTAAERPATPAQRAAILRRFGVSRAASISPDERRTRAKAATQGLSAGVTVTKAMYRPASAR
jgi:hypothetical protein